MENAKQLTLPNISEAYMKAADVLLVLDDGTAVLCHSQVLSMHSAVICNMLSDLASQHNEKVMIPLVDLTEAQCSALLAYLHNQHNEKTRIPLADFTEEQCSALLAYLYDHSTSCKGAAFAGHDTADHDAAVAVVRFAHIYDVPHALQHVQTYLTAFMETRFKSKQCAGMIEESCDKVVLEWAIMAEKFNMHELCGHCERAMMMYWECFDDKPELTDQLSSRSVLPRACTRTFWLQQGITWSRTILMSRSLLRGGNRRQPRVTASIHQPQHDVGAN